MATIHFTDPNQLVDVIEVADAASVLTPLRELDAVIQQMAHNMHAGRLSISNTDPVAQSSTPVSTIYLMPFDGNVSAQRNASGDWIPRQIPDAGIALPLGALAGSTNYDVFEYDNGGNIALETVAWASGTARATALQFVDGVYVKSGATTRKYRGSFRTSGSVQVYDSNSGPAISYLWNAFNRVVRRMRYSDATASWNYVVGANRPSNNNASAVCQFLAGLSIDAALATFQESVSGLSTVAYTGIGYDTLAAMVALARASVEGSMSTQYALVPTIGVHYFSAMEFGATGATFWGGSEHGLNVLWRA